MQIGKTRIPRDVHIEKADTNTPAAIDRLSLPASSPDSRQTGCNDHRSRLTIANDDPGCNEESTKIKDHDHKMQGHPGRTNSDPWMPFWHLYRDVHKHLETTQWEVSVERPRLHAVFRRTSWIQSRLATGFQPDPRTQKYIISTYNTWPIQPEHGQERRHLKMIDAALSMASKVCGILRPRS